MLNQIEPNKVDPPYGGDRVREKFSKPLSKIKCLLMLQYMLYNNIMI